MTREPAGIRFEWRSEHPAPVEAKRAAVLDGKPACRECGIMFHPRYTPPADLVCRECRRRQNDADAADSLF